MKRLTGKTICKAIKEKHGIDVSIFNGDGYWYFYSDHYETSLILNSFQSTSILVMRLNWMPLERWVEMFEWLFDGEDYTIEDIKRCQQV